MVNGKPVWFLLICTLFFSHALEMVDSGSIYLFNKDFNCAIQYYQQEISNNPQSLTAHRSYQDACFNYSDSTKISVITFYKDLLEENIGSPLHYYLYGRCLSCAKGIAYFDSALAQSTCYTWALNARGACFFEQGDYANAKEEFLRIIKCDPDYEEAYRNLSQVYLQKKQFRRAKKVFRKLIARDRKNARVYEWLGDMYLNLKKYEYAALAYTKSAKLGAKGAGLFFKLGYTWYEQKNYPAARKSYQKSIANGNTNYEVYFNLGSVFELMDMPEEALERYQNAFDKSGNNSVLYAMGNCAVQLGLYSQAIQWYNAFLLEKPGHTETLTGLANAYQLKKDFSRAIAIYEKIIQQDKLFAKAYYNLGSIYAYYLKDYAKMKEYWEHYITLFPHAEDAAFIKREMIKIGKK